jgi:DNA replication protein DnaC
MDADHPNSLDRKRREPRTPASHICPFCGKTVEHVRLPAFGSSFYFRKLCTCEYDFEKREAADRASLERTTKIQNHLLYGSGLVGILAGMHFENFHREEQPAAYDACAAFADALLKGVTDGPNLVISGAYGSGKTHLAAAVLRRVCLGEIFGVMASLPELRRKLVAAFSDKEDGEGRVLAVYQNTPLLVIDDWGAEEKSSEWLQGSLFLIINHRYLQSLPMVITTNYSKEEFLAAVGGRIGGRIMERATWVEMSPKNYRVKLRRKRLEKNGN